jgi:hypothetical protein
MDIEDLENEAAEEEPGPRPRPNPTPPTPERQARDKKLADASKRRFIISMIFASGAIVAGATGLIFKDSIKLDLGEGIEELELSDFESEEETEKGDPRFKTLSQQSVRHIPLEPAEREAKFQVALEAEKAKKNGVFDTTTQNWIAGRSYENRIDDPLVQGEVHGHTLIAKKAVMERFDAAWEVLKEAGIDFEGTTEVGNFRKNTTQYILYERNETREDKQWVGSMTGSYHLLGQAIDVKQMGGGKLTKERQKIRDVLKIFGFTWGIKGRRMKLKKKAIQSWGDIVGAGKEIYRGKNWKKVLKGLMKAVQTEDRVHFQMKKSDLDGALPIEQAKEKAREYLGIKK